MRKTTDGTAETVVCLVVFSLLDVVPPHHLDLANIRILLPLQEVDFFQKLPVEAQREDQRSYMLKALLRTARGALAASCYYLVGKMTKYCLVAN